MCSFLMTTLCFTASSQNTKMQRRGPDLTTQKTFRNVTFVHNLLWMTGELTPQPIVKRKVAVLFNGEIYNFDGSEGRKILEAYDNFGETFPRHLDGEWAIALADFGRDKLILATDIFGTKPLYYAAESGQWAVATYRSGIPEPLRGHAVPVPPNTVIVASLTSGRRQRTHEIHRFSLRQFKTTTDDWEAAFFKAVKKRSRRGTTTTRPFVGLSGGHDSGAIALALAELDVPHDLITAASPVSLEMDLINQRVAYAKDRSRDVRSDVVHLVNFGDERAILQSRCEEYTYSEAHTAGRVRINLVDDRAAVALSAVCGVAREKFGSLIYLSGAGAGADETISDYGFNGTKLAPHSHFGGLFPEDLATIFPWPSFFGGTQRDYLAKEELVAGTHGVEARYPFLDPAVVQEYLWLTADLKNSLYKRPITDFLRRYRYPALTGATKLPFQVRDDPMGDARQSGGVEPPKSRILGSPLALLLTTEEINKDSDIVLRRRETRRTCDEWIKLVVDFVDAASHFAAAPKLRDDDDDQDCRPYHAVNRFFKGQAAPALRGVAQCPTSYDPLVAALARSTNNHTSTAWRDTIQYALAGLHYAAGAGHWDPRVDFPTPSTPLSVSGDADARAAINARSRPRNLLSLDDDQLFGMIRAVTVASERRPELASLEASALTAGIPLHVLGLDHTELALGSGYSHDWKLRLLKDYVDDLDNSNDVLLVVDAYDVLFAPDARTTIAANYKGGLVFSSEVDCWPDAVVCDLVEAQLNSGAFIGTVGVMRRALTVLVASYGAFATCGTADQRAWQRFALDFPVTLDTNGTMFQTMHGYNWTINVDDPFALDGTRGNDHRSVRPAVLHFNSYDGKAMYQNFLDATTRNDLAVFVVSLAERGAERREAIQQWLPRSVEFVDAIDGDDLVEEDAAVFERRWRTPSGRSIRTADWTDTLLGGGAMDDRLTKRITATFLSHLKAIDRAMAVDRWPALILEDDVDLSDFAALERTLREYVASTEDDWSVIQVGYLLDDAHLAARLLRERCVNKRSVMRRDRCAPAERFVGAQAYLVSRRGAETILDRFSHGDMIAADALNFAADYALFDMDGALVATAPLVLEKTDMASTISTGHKALAVATRSLAAVLTDAPCDSAVVQAVSLDERRQSVEGFFVFAGDTLVKVSTSDFSHSDLADALGVTDPKVRKLLALALKQCDRNCAGRRQGVLFPSPMRCFLVDAITLDLCGTWGLTDGTPACVDLVTALNAAVQWTRGIPCGRFSCLTLSSKDRLFTHQTTNLRQVVATAIDGTSLETYCRRLEVATANTTSGAVFGAVADSLAAGDRVQTSLLRLLSPTEYY